MKNIFLSVLIIYTLSACSEKKPIVQTVTAPSLPVINISRTSALTSSEYPASIQGTVNVEIRPQISGNLEKVFVDEGVYVTKGQALFKINDLPFRAQLNSAIASLHASESASINAQLEVDKFTPLVQNKVVSEYQLKTAQANYKTALANIAQAKAMVNTAEINLGYTLIKAPVSGFIGRLPKKQGSLVSSADVEALTQLSDVHEVHVYFSLGESDFIAFKSQYEGFSISDKIKNLPPVSLILPDNSVYSEKGKIDMVDGQVDKNTGAITLRATFPNAKGLLRSGNTGKVNLSVQHENALLVPQEATIEIQDKIFVFTVDKNNKVAKQPITISGRSGTNYLVKDGVKEGNRIVFKGFENLQEGTIIAPENTDKEIAKN